MTDDLLLTLPIVVPLSAATVTLLLRRWRVVVRAVTLTVALSVVAVGVWLLTATSDGQAVATHLAGVTPPFAITLVADTFSALLVTVTGVVLVATMWFAIRGDHDLHPFFHPLVGVLVTGICGAFLTADLFNLFVMFEIMLMASYVLVGLDGRAVALRAGATYVAVNLLGSTLLLAGVGLTYAVAGTVNIAELGTLGGTTTTRLAVPGAFMLVAFATKGGLVPVHGWLPVAYATTSPAVAALFSGLLTKVGIYALYRVYSGVFAGDPQLRTGVLVAAGLTMAGGVVAALGQDGLRRILSFHVTSQVGYMLMGLGLFGPLGLAGGVFYIIHHIVVKTALFIGAGAVETERGTDDLDRLGGIVREHPVLAAGFGVAALSLAGVPPFSGFPAKLTLLQAALADGRFVIAATSLLVSLLTLTSMGKIWNGAFWGERPVAPRPTPPLADRGRVPIVAGGAPDEPGPVGIAASGADGPRQPEPQPASAASRRSRPPVGGLVLLAVITVALGLGADVLFDLARSAAEGLIDPTAYRDAVLGGSS